MIRKLMVVSLSLVLCLALATPILAQVAYNSPGEYEQATGNKIESFSQAPMLRTMVASGEIPSLEERLPIEPLVVEPVEEIGQYGETLQVVMQGSPSSWDFNNYMLHEFPIAITPDIDDMYPNWLKAFKSSDDYKTWTLQLREGLRWSDGAPFTTDDVMFWYEDIIKNEELFPAKPVAMMHGGELAEVEKVDDYTVEFRFAAPFPVFAQNFLTHPSYMYNTGPIPRPKHYLMEYHIKYNSDANELAKKEGFDYWYQLFGAKGGLTASGYTVIGRPTLEAWTLKAIGPTHATFERNPYYWKVDTAGNQLPYIDRIEIKAVTSQAAYLMSVMGGETDFASGQVTMADIPLLKANEEEGGYETRLWQRMWACGVGFLFYQQHEDPVMAKILQDVRFRRAMSLALNRQEMSDLIFFGMGTPSQATVPPVSKYFVPETWQSYAQYDVEEANRLLDEMDLEWNEEHTFRLRPDGKPLSVKIEGAAGEADKGPYLAAGELTKGYWEVVGVKTDFDFTDLIGQRRDAGKVMVKFASAAMPPDFTYKGTVLTPGDFSHWAPMKWRDAWLEGGRAAAEKAEVPEDIIRYLELIEEFAAAVGEEEKIEVAKQLNLLFSKNLYMIGTAAGPLPSPVVVKNYLRNVPQLAYKGYTYSFHQNVTIPAQYFISK